MAHHLLPLDAVASDDLYPQNIAWRTLQSGGIIGAFLRRRRLSPRGWWRRASISALAALTLQAFVPAAGRADCTGGGTSAVQPPATTFLRSYRAAFGSPTRIATDSSGNLYVTDPGQGQVVVRAPNGRIVSRLTDLGHPISVAVGSTGRIYVGDGASGSVTVFGPDWQPLFKLGQGIGEFLLPNDLASDAVTGNVYVADSPAHLVKVYSAAGLFVQSFGGEGSGDGRLNFPVGVFVDAGMRQVWVADQLNARIDIFDIGGNFLSCIGGKGSAVGAFNMPQGVLVDGHGRVFVADSFEGRIQVLDRNGDFVGFIGDFGETGGQLRIPTGMVIDPSNRLFVAAANNARLEVFGLDAFADPESIIPAVVTMEPNRLDRASPDVVIVGYVEVPGYPLERIAVGSIRANGVSANVNVIVGDHDGNGVPDLRVEFNRAALLATLPADGPGIVAVSGQLGTAQFEASDNVEITICGVGTICSLGDADPQCNEAVCIAPIGCTVQPKADGIGCEDGNACTIDDVCSDGTCVGASLRCDDGNVCTDDSCDAVAGCVFASNTLPCDDGSVCTVADTCVAGVCAGTPLSCDDGNACTTDGCDPVNGCVYTNNTEPCDDGNACTVADACAGGGCLGVPRACDDGNVCTDDACNPASGCVYTNNLSACDDADPGTVHDTCNGTGTCQGQAVIGNYAILRWPLESNGHRSVTLTDHDLIQGDVCGESIRLGSFDRIQGNVVAWATEGRAITFRPRSEITGNVVTGGGAMLGIEPLTIGGRVDQSGAATEISECFAARYRANTWRANLAALVAAPDLTLTTIDQPSGTGRRLPSVGALGAGQIVIDVGDIRLHPSSTLTLAGTAATDAVIVHVRGRMVLGSAAQILTDGVPPERVIFVIDGSVILRRDARVAGSVFTAGRVQMGPASTISGALLGSIIDLSPYATVSLHPFLGW